MPQKQAVVLRWTEESQYEKRMTLAEAIELLEVILPDEPAPTTLAEAARKINERSFCGSFHEGTLLEDALSDYQDDTYESSERDVEEATVESA